MGKPWRVIVQGPVGGQWRSVEIGQFGFAEWGTAAARDLAPLLGAEALVRVYRNGDGDAFATDCAGAQVYTWEAFPNTPVLARTPTDAARILAHAVRESLAARLEAEGVWTAERADAWARPSGEVFDSAQYGLRRAAMDWLLDQPYAFGEGAPGGTTVTHAGSVGRR